MNKDASHHQQQVNVNLPSVIWTGFDLVLPSKSDGMLMYNWRKGLVVSRAR